ncbi:CheR family methyltransferase [Pseudaestuariivita sp.]|uniref:CheR family methyltransferase n=1 Tax=Pseudaestuariivita sp. TaxID=2211669 RepID=UPI004059F90F
MPFYPEATCVKGSRVTDTRTYFIGIAASAGGLEAVSQLAQNLPEDAPAVYVLAQHMSPHHKSLLTSLLSHETSLPVIELTASDVMPERNTIYVTPPNTDVVLEDGQFRLRPPSEHAAPPKPSADRLFKSLAQECGEYCMGVVLSGTGSDGSYGVQAIREAGGITIAQEASTAKYDGMPSSAVATGCVDLTLTPEQIGVHLGKILSSSRDFGALKTLNEQPGRMTDLMHILLARTRVDFRDYKENTVNRRIARRMVALGIDEYDDYVAFCRVSTDEVDALFRDLLISVTRFFRDPDQFAALGTQLEELVKAKGDAPLRVWVAGCATGEEAYSIAILLAQAMGGLDKLDKARLQIFATDIDARALDVARAGLYPISAVQGVPEKYVRDYFDMQSGKLKVKRALRAVTLFSHHNIFQDPPFMNVDVVSLRNVLIYFNPMLQERVLTRLHYALAPRGLLFLGTSETVGNMQAQYRPTQGADKIFAKREAFREKLADRLALANVRALPRAEAPRLPGVPVAAQANSNAQKMYDALLRGVAENGFIATRGQTILRVLGEITPFLRLSDKSRLTLSTDLLAPPLRDDVVSLITLSLRHNARRNGQWHKTRTDGNQEARAVVYPLGPMDDGEEHVLVAIETRESTKLDTQVDTLSEAERLEYLKHIESEMVSTREALQQTVEELQTSNEELQSVNEELQSTNEELQATNEELETSNEELQSTNEELITVNEEMKVSSSELQKISTELEAILDSIPYPIMVVDEALMIRRASRSGSGFFGLPDLAPTRMHLTQCTPQPGFPSLIDAAGEVFRTRQQKVIPFETGLRARRLYFAPFRDGHGDVIGLTISAQEIDLSSIGKMTDLMDRLGGISHWRYNLIVNRLTWSREVFHIHGLDPDKGEPSVDKAIDFYHPDDRPLVRTSLDRCIATKSEFAFDARLKRADGQEIAVRSVGTAVLGDGGQVVALVGAFKRLDQ